MSRPETTVKQKLYKLIWYAPESDVDVTKAAVFAVGAGQIGNDYIECAFQTKGTGQFKPINNANPTIGGVGQLEYVEEWRIEVIVTKKNLKKAVTALIKAHSYEEPAWEVIELVDLDTISSADDDDDKVDV